MSQERTEQRSKIEDSLRNFRVGVSKFQEPECGEWVEDLRIMDSEGWDIDAERANKVREALEIGAQAFAEIDRLNAVIRDLHAENEIFRGDIADNDELIQRQAAEMHRRNAVIIDLQKEITDLTKKVRDKEIERLSWSNGEQVKEIERLRAALEQFEKMPIARLNATAMKMREIANAVLKGAE